MRGIWIPAEIYLHEKQCQLHRAFRIFEPDETGLGLVLTHPQDPWSSTVFSGIVASAY